MSGGGREQERLAQQFPGNQPRQGLAFGGEGRYGEVGVPVGDLAGGAAPEFGHDEDLRSERGVAGGQPGERRRQQPGGGAAERRDPQRPRQRPRRGAAGFGAEQVELPQDLPRVDEGDLAPRGRARPGAAALDKTAPAFRSHSRTARETANCVRPRDRAAAVKLPVLPTASSSRRSCGLSAPEPLSEGRSVTRPEYLLSMSVTHGQPVIQQAAHLPDRIGRAYR